jgi:hypothetical protein
MLAEMFLTPHVMAYICCENRHLLQSEILVASYCLYRTVNTLSNNFNEPP